ncbi:MAG: 4Fe-4S dicluster domain-containing protein [Actinomycetota bacterium]
MNDPIVFERAGVDALISELNDRGYEVVGPTVRGQTIMYDTITSTGDLPVGLRDKQEAGSYRLEERGDDALFGYVVGPQSFKKYLTPPGSVFWKGLRTETGFETVEPEEPPKYAFFGARPCEVAAMRIQDDVYLPVADGVYTERRERSFTVAVNCTEPAATCFCASLGTGPDVTEGFDIALTEVVSGDHHYFLAEAGSDEGVDVLGALEERPARDEELVASRRLVMHAADHMGRTLDTKDLKDLLYANVANPYWEEIGERCLSCTNCTMVCPTCFCSTVEDRQALDGSSAERVRTWDSCFTLDFSYIHGGPVRSSSGARYRQWMTHKLASWQDQFGSIGCVGCGRCIAWCPVGIDITQEAATIREVDVRKAAIPVPSVKEEVG